MTFSALLKEIYQIFLGFSHQGLKSSTVGGVKMCPSRCPSCTSYLFTYACNALRQEWRDTGTDMILDSHWFALAPGPGLTLQGRLTRTATFCLLYILDGCQDFKGFKQFLTDAIHMMSIAFISRCSSLKRCKVWNPENIVNCSLYYVVNNILLIRYLCYVL